MEQLAQLVHEVERLVTAPYVPSLHGLYNLLQQGSASSIDSWASCKPCQVGLLTNVLVEALSRSRVALPLIAAFAASSNFRDALLERHPVILDAFLEKAMNGDEPEYYSACIAFFTSPLPDTFVAPARIAPFVAKLVSMMAANPCVETVAPLHALINGLKGSPGILDDIPSEIMSNLQLEFTKTLRNLDDHMGNLLCLATFAQIATGRTTTPQYQHGSEGQWLLNIKHFFGAKRGLKTLDLVVLRVILACSSSCNLGPQDATESIRLAITIADAIEPEQKQAWIASNSAKISKLREKAVKDGLYGGIQTMAIVFLHVLLPVQSLSSQLRDFGLKILLSKNSQGTLELLSPELIARLGKSLADTGVSATRELTTFTFAALKGSQWQSREIVSTIRLAHLILTGLQKVEPETVRFSIKNSISALSQIVGETIEHFPRQPCESQCSQSIVCTSQLCRMQNQLFLSLLNLYSTNSSAQTGVDIIMRSFMRRVEQSLPNTQCAFSTGSPSNFQRSVTLRHHSEFSSTTINRDWRAGFTDVFMQNAKTTHDSMMRKIEDTCFDLERRCEDVEGPLRVVEQDRDKYAEENEKLKTRNEELIEQLRQKTDELEDARRKSSEHLTEFGHEHARLEQLLQDQYKYRDELTGSIESVRAELQELKKSSEIDIFAEKERARSKELEMMATLTGKEDQIEDLQGEIRDMQMQNEQKSRTLAQVLKDNDTSRQALNSLELELAGAAQSLEQSRLLNAQKEDEISRLLAQEVGLRKELETLQTATKQWNAEIDRLGSALQQSEENLQSEAERLNNEASLATAEIAKMNAENQRLQAAMQAATIVASKDAQSKDKRIHHLERKVQALRDERAAKAREFSEAQQHIGRLMGVMGFAANAPESTSPHYQRTKSTNHTPVARIRQPISDDEEETQTQSSQYMPMGPTPKRPRGNRKSAVPHTSTSPAAISKTRSPPAGPRSVRKPLAEADLNSPAKIPSSNGSKHSQVDMVPGTQARESFEDNHLRDLDLDMDLEFSKDFLFSSTAFTGSNEQAGLQ